MSMTTRPPVTKLVNELLSEIFVAYSELNYDTPLAQLLLTHICHSWRDIALNSTPRLWSILYMSFGQTFSNFDHQSMITAWLNRSVLPADVRIEQQPPPDLWTPYRPIPRGVVKALIPHAPRIQSLKIQGMQKSWTPLITLPSGSFPILTMLDMTIDRARLDYPPKTPKTPAAFDKSPLRTLKWWWGQHESGKTWMILEGDVIFNHFSFDGTHVTSLVLEDTSVMTVENSWNPVAKFPNVVDCTVYLGDCHIQYSTMAQLTFPKLTTFTLKIDSEAALVESNALAFINAPCLTELHFHFPTFTAWGYDPNNTLCTALDGFSKRYHLTHLSLIRANLISAAELPVIINAFSSLRSFTFFAKKVPAKTFLQSLLCKNKEEQPVLPYLEYLRFGRYNKRSPVPKQVLDLVESRWLEEKMERFRIQSRLMKVQLDQVVQLKIPEPPGPPETPPTEVPPASVSEPLELQDEWLARFNAAENKRLQRLQAGGFSIAEGIIYFPSHY